MDIFVHYGPKCNFFFIDAQELIMNLYLRLNYGTASEHLKYHAQALYGAL